MEGHSFNEALQKKVDALKDDFNEVDAELQRQSAKLTAPLYEKRAAILAEEPGFWPKALLNCPHVAMYVDDVDQDLLEKLESITLVTGADPRESTLTFKFAPNDYFSDTELVKKFTVKPDAPALGTDEAEWVEDVETKKVTINWKSDDKNLSKKRPMTGVDSEEFNPGSLFASFFEADESAAVVTNALGDAFVNTFFPNAISFYTGEITEFGEGDFTGDFGDSEDEEDDDDDADEIDLEEADKKRPAKKPKVA